MQYEKALVFAAGVIVGAGAVCFIRSESGRKAAVAVASKGLELKERVAGLAERVKEAADDVMAEARYANEQKPDAN